MYPYLFHTGFAVYSEFVVSIVSVENITPDGESSVLVTTDNYEERMGTLVGFVVSDRLHFFLVLVTKLRRTVWMGMPFTDV
jgi:hypothetical protein